MDNIVSSVNNYNDASLQYELYSHTCYAVSSIASAHGEVTKKRKKWLDHATSEMIQPDKRRKELQMKPEQPRTN